ncbi:MAG: proprotein convertase P-domain-containing protein [Anaerolineae bacterium]
MLLMIGVIAFASADPLQPNVSVPHSGSRVAIGQNSGQSSPVLATNKLDSAVQTKPATDGPTVLQPDHIDISPPLRDIAPIITSQSDPALMRFQESEVLPGHEKVGSFSSVDSTYQNSHGPLAMPAPIQNWDGINNVGYSMRPPDTVGDVGLNHYVQWVNVRFQIWNKTGTSLYGPANGNTLWSGFGGQCESANDGDPVVLYDHLADRWVMMQFAITSTPNMICMAVSQTPDPLGSWYRYSYSWPSNYMPDYPKMGLWPDGYYLTVNQFTQAGAWVGGGVAAFERTKMLTGASAQVISYNVGATYGGMLPADWEGSTPPPAGAPIPFAEWDDSAWIAPSDALRIWNFHVDWTTIANSYFGTALAPNYTLTTTDVDPTICTTEPCINQPGTTQNVDSLADRIMHRLQYRNFGGYQTLVGNHTVDTNSPAGRAGIHWFELRNTGSAWSINQQGVYGPADTTSTSRWMGSIAMDSAGNMALGYSITDNVSLYPSIRYVGRLASDATGTMPQSETTLVTGGGYQNDSYGRWGDYSAMQVDPVDDCTFWYTQEYAQSNGAYNWYTRIGSFKFANCSATPDFTIAATPATVDVCAPANAQYTVALTALYGFSSPVTLSASGNPSGTTATFSPNPATPTANSTLTIGNTGAAAAGSYPLTLTGTSGALSHTANVTLNIATAAATAPTLTAPANATTGVATTPAFTWSAVSGASSYTIQVATDPSFSNIVASASGLTSTTWTPSSALLSDTVYYWRVQAVNSCGGTWSAVFAFRTGVNPCTTYTSTDVPKAIPDAGTVQSSLTVPDSFTLTDVNVTIGSIVHTWDSDLDISIIHPDTTSRELSTDNGGSGDNYTNTVFDDEAATAITAGTAPFTGSFRPEAALSALDGKTSAGTWKLNVADDVADDTGTLNAWSITLCGNLTAITADYSDLASAYGVAWHTGNGALKLGPTWTADTTFGADSDSDDGVSFVTPFQKNQNATVRVNVQGTPSAGRWLRVWFDWDNSGVFDTTELVYNAAAVTGDNDLTVAVPNSLTTAVKYRVRLYDSASAPAGAGEAMDAGSYGAATGGEVEDGSSPVPLVVFLSNFSAMQTGNQVDVTWETATEQNNRGFNLYRGTTSDAWDRQLNTELIPSQAQGSASGFIYTWQDADDLVNSQPYYYWLQDIDVNGVATLHGPVSVIFTTPTAVTLTDLHTSSSGHGVWLALAAALLIILGLVRVHALRHAARRLAE